MKVSKISHSSSGEYYHGGHMYRASGGSVAMLVREDGLIRYELHYYANLGNMVQEITRAEYLSTLAQILASEGTKHHEWGCVMSVYVSISSPSFYAGDWTHAEANAPTNPRERKRAARGLLY